MQLRTTSNSSLRRLWNEKVTIVKYPINKNMFKGSCPTPLFKKTHHLTNPSKHTHEFLGLYFLSIALKTMTPITKIVLRKKTRAFDNNQFPFRMVTH